MSKSSGDNDTVLTVPRTGWAASFLVRLKLEPRLEPDDVDALADELLRKDVLDALEEAVDLARPHESISRQLRHALELLRDGEFVLAWPPLATAVEGLYWEEAIRTGFVDPESLRTSSGQAARSAHDIFEALPINERVRRMLSRYAFGSEANAFRHGWRAAWGERHQCAIWLLALITWFDGYGWRYFNSSELRS